MSIPTHQEEVMSKTVPMQHPAVVLRSHYRQLRSLLAVAIVAVVGLSGTVVVLAIDDGGTSSPVTSVSASTRPTGGPDESKTAAAIGSQPESGPLAKWHQYEQAISDMTPKQRAAAFGPGR
jgi:hypothetical protein